MDLMKLSNEQLKDEFLRVSQEYNQAIDGHPGDHTFEESFRRISNHLNAILDELKRRREEQN